MRKIFIISALFLCISPLTAKQFSVDATSVKSKMEGMHFASDPMQELKVWEKLAKEHGSSNQNNVIITNIQANGWPTSRVLTLKTITPNGIIFGTNPLSIKYAEFAKDSRVHALMMWKDPKDNLEKHVRIEGHLIECSETDSFDFKLADKDHHIDWHYMLLKPTRVAFKIGFKEDSTYMVERTHYTQEGSSWKKERLPEYYMVSIDEDDRSFSCE